jgi:sigma-E factor negative regulatory protein RseC
MIEQQGLVIAASGKIVSVRLGGSSGCAACDAGKGCGAGVFGRLLQRKPVVLDLHNEPGALVGQAVMVGLPETLFLRLVLSFYLYPLLAGLAGAIIGHYVSVKLKAGPATTDGLTLLGAVLAGTMALVWKRQGHKQPAVDFPGEPAVYLLRVVDRAISEQCDTAIPATRH